MNKKPKKTVKIPQDKKPQTPSAIIAQHGHGFMETLIISMLDNAYSRQISDLDVQSCFASDPDNYCVIMAEWYNAVRKEGRVAEKQLLKNALAKLSAEEIEMLREHFEDNDANDFD